MNLTKTLVAAGAFVLAGGAASAATVSFSGSADGTDFGISFDDDTAGLITVEVTSTANPNQADLLGLAFDWSGAVSPANTFDPGDFTTISSNTGEAITDVCTNTLTCGGGLNFNGTGVLAFDYIVRMGDQGTQGGNYLENFQFSIASLFSLDKVLGDSFGIRAQSTGDDGEGSIKLINFERTPTTVIPLPAAGWLLIGGLGGLMALRRRKS